MIDAYLTDDVTRYIDAGIDEWNTRTYATEEIKGMVFFKTKLVRNMEGEEVVSNAQVLISIEQAMSHKDRVKLEGESFTHPIINIGRPRDFSEVMKEVYLE